LLVRQHDGDVLGAEACHAQPIDGDFERRPIGIQAEYRDVVWHLLPPELLWLRARSRPFGRCRARARIHLSLNATSS